MAGGNRLRLLENGAGFFPALLAAFDAARHDIRLETYIFELDETGNAVAEALIHAARRGVTVRVLMDGVGSRDFHDTMRERFQAAGVQSLFYRPELSPYRLRRHRLRRMHRKLAVVDGRLAFVGGINIVDDRTRQDGLDERYDYAVELEGPLLVEICQAMDRLWWLVGWSRLGRRPAGMPSLSPPRTVVAGDQTAEFMTRDNLRNRRVIEEAYLEVIRTARDEILIANAYFLPGHRFRNALVDAAERGVRVVLLLQGRTDHRLYKWAARALYGHLLSRGVEIHEYTASEMHAKVAVVDQAWATVGSSNIDPFSLMLAREANLMSRDVRFCAELRSSLRHAMLKGGVPIPARDWEARPWFERAGSWAVYGLVRLSLAVLGYGHFENA